MIKSLREDKEGAEQFGRTGLGGWAEAAKRLLWERLFKLPHTQLSPSEGRPCPGDNGWRSCFRRAGHGGRKGIPGADRKASSGTLGVQGGDSKTTIAEPTPNFALSSS